MTSDRVRSVLLIAAAIVAIAVVFGRDLLWPEAIVAPATNEGHARATERVAAHEDPSNDTASRTETDIALTRIATTTPEPSSRPASLTVRVRSNEGEPVAGAPILVVLADSQTARDVMTSDTIVRTDPAGEARFADLSPGLHLVSCATKSFQSIELHAGDDRVVELIVTRNLRLSGRVLDPDGNGIADAEIVGQDHDVSAAAVFGRSDRDGRYQVEVAGFGVPFFAQESGYTSSSIHVSSVGEEIVDFRLERARGRLTGVVRARHGRGIEGVSLFAETSSPAGSTTRRFPKSYDRLRWPKITSARDGTFAFDSLPLGDLVIHAAHDDHPPTSAQVTIEAGRATHCELVLTEGATMHGRVLDAFGAPLADATVHTHLSAPYPSRRTRTNPHGEFVFRGLPTGTVNVHASHPLGISADLEVDIATADDTVRPEIRLHATAVQRGIVIDADGAPMRGQLVYGHHREHGSTSTLTGADGRFGLRLFAGASSVVEVYASSHGEHHRLARFGEVVPGDVELRIVVPDSVRPSAGVRAIVLRPPGYEREPLLLFLKGRDGEVSRMASVAFTGTLHIHGIAPGDYSLRTVGMRSRFHDDLLGEFTLAAEQTLDLGTITIPAPVVPALVARTTTGRAIADLAGDLLALPARSKVCALGLRNGQDSWQPPLAEGEYVLVIQDGDGFAGKEVHVSLRRGPPNRIEVTLESLQRVRVELRTSDGGAVPESLAFEVRDAHGNARQARSKGTELALSLRTGAHRIVGGDPGWSGEITLEAVAESDEVLTRRLELHVRR